MHQYCNIHSPPLDAHVLINPPTSALGFPNNGHIFTNHYLGLATSSLQFTLHSAFKHLGWLEFVFHQRAFHQLLLGHVCDIFKKAKTKIEWMKVRNVIWIWKPVQCVVNSQLCPSGILKGDNSVLNFTGILATEATVVHQPWDSCYMLCLTKNSAIRRC